MRQSQAASQLPAQVTNFGVTVQKSTSAPLMLFALYSPQRHLRQHLPGQLRLHQPERRVDPGARHRQRHGLRRGPICHAHLGQPRRPGAAQHHRLRKSFRRSKIRTRSIPPGKSAGAGPAGAGIHLYGEGAGASVTEADFGNIVIRANPDGSVVRVRDVARVELGAQTYNMIGRFNGKPAALLALYQIPGSNALDAADGAKKLMAELSKRFPPDMEYVVALDTTLAVSAGMDEIEQDAGGGADPRRAGGLHLPARLARDADSAARGAGVARSARSRSSRCSAFPSTRFRCSVSCWPSALWSMTPSWWWRPSSITSNRGFRRRTPRSRRWRRFPARSWPSR